MKYACYALAYILRTSVLELDRQVFFKARASVAWSTADASHSKISRTFFPPVIPALLAEKGAG